MRNVILAAASLAAFSVVACGDAAGVQVRPVADTTTTDPTPITPSPGGSSGNPGTTYPTTGYDGGTGGGSSGNPGNPGNPGGNPGGGTPGTASSSGAGTGGLGEGWHCESSNECSSVGGKPLQCTQLNNDPDSTSCRLPCSTDNDCSALGRNYACTTIVVNSSSVSVCLPGGGGSPSGGYPGGGSSGCTGGCGPCGC